MNTIINFYKNVHRKSQVHKLKSLLHYFEWLDKNNNEGSIKITRQVILSHDFTLPIRYTSTRLK